jgi:hypothetical protein
MPASPPVPALAIDGIAQRLAALEPTDVLDRDLAEPRHVVDGHARDVRRQDRVRRLPERRFRAERLLLEHVARHAREPARAQRLGERVLVDDAAARQVDQVRARPQPGELARADRAARLGREREEHDHVVGLAHHALHAGGVGAEHEIDAVRGLGLPLRADHAHAEPSRLHGDGLADRAEAQDPERLSRHRLDHVELPEVPALLLERARQLLREREDHRQSELAHLRAVDAARVRDLHAGREVRRGQERVDARAHHLDEAQRARRRPDAARRAERDQRLDVRQPRAQVLLAVPDDDLVPGQRRAQRPRDRLAERALEAVVDVDPRDRLGGRHRRDSIARV